MNSYTFIGSKSQHDIRSVMKSIKNKAGILGVQWPICTTLKWALKRIQGAIITLIYLPFKEKYVGDTADQIDLFL